MNVMIRLFVGNIPYGWSETDLLNNLAYTPQLREAVQGVMIRRDDRQRSAGWGYIEVVPGSESEFLKFDGTAFNNRYLRINLWRSK